MKRKHSGYRMRVDRALRLCTRLFPPSTTAGNRKSCTCCKYCGAVDRHGKLDVPLPVSCWKCGSDDVVHYCASSSGIISNVMNQWKASKDMPVKPARR